MEVPSQLACFSLQLTEALLYKFRPSNEMKHQLNQLKKTVLIVHEYVCTYTLGCGALYMRLCVLTRLGRPYCFQVPSSVQPFFFFFFFFN